ncbi:MBL fold metallo-hydrolase [Sphingobacterium bovisgrunnientis]|jgi:glyoxylase-like metal-dependent hydrolase (beta-lactamase superfamily II)|uniref:MBL fold metallo-hydrolase n=1 Tax=Sphingobacterium bovisgrunnientis TaxID=1874697 RepID=UPI00135C1A86|nr:MBL fold metallo-hydrolase [Sphingobacterium bovisgrunnientis]
MIQAYSLFEGSFSVDASKKFVPFDPEKDDPKSRPASLFVHVHPFLIESSNGLILCDAGLGFRTDEDELLIHQNIRKLGFEPEDVKYVLMSHLHKDHTGGLVDFKDGVGRVAFPEAEYIIQRGEWENAYSTESASYRTEVFDVIQRSGNLTLVEGEGIVNNEIRYEINGGHTEYHQAFHIETGGEHFFFGGDVLPEPEELFKNFIAKYDFDGRASRDKRKEYWEQGAPEGWIYLFYHGKSLAMGLPKLKDDGTYKLVDPNK